MTSTEPHTLSATWAELPSLVGRSFRSAYLRVDQAHVDGFEFSTYVTENPHQMDDDLYQPGLIEGFHLLGLFDHLSNGALYVDDPTWAGWNYGFDHVRFVSEVTTSDQICLSGTVASVEPRGHRYLVTLDCTLEVAGRTKPGAVATWKVMWTRNAEEGDA